MNIRNFDLNLLLVFDALMRERNVSRVADQLALSQPAISNALNRLRALLEDQLLVRTAQGMQPTAVALALEQPIREALRQIDLTLNRGGIFDPANSTLSFVFAVTDYVEYSVMPALLSQMTAIAPGISIETVDLGPDLSTEELDSGRIDVAVGRFLKLPPRTECWHWQQETLVLVAHRDNPLVHEGLTLNEFIQLPHIWVSGGQRRGMVDAWLEENDLQRHIAYTTPNYLLAPHIAAASDLVVVLPRSLAEQQARLLPLKMVALPMELPPFQIDLVWSALRQQDQALQWLLEQTRQVLQGAQQQAECSS